VKRWRTCAGFSNSSTKAMAKSSFLAPLENLVSWADAHHKDIVLARRRHAAADGARADEARA